MSQREKLLKQADGMLIAVMKVIGYSALKAEMLKKIENFRQTVIDYSGCDDSIEANVHHLRKDIFDNFQEISESEFEEYNGKYKGVERTADELKFQYANKKEVIIQDYGAFIELLPTCFPIRGEFKRLLKSAVDDFKSENDLAWLALAKININLENAKLQLYSYNKEKELEKAKAPSIKGGQYSPWKKHEAIIVEVLNKVESNENKLKQLRDPSRITQGKAREIISIATNQEVSNSTFNTWLNKFRKSHGKVFS